jgi:hypothetical protein
MKTVTLSDDVYELIKGQLVETNFSINALNEIIGKNFFFRTVTYHLVGKVEKIIDDFIVLKDASWVADSGRFSNAIKKGTLSEVEPVGDAMLNIKTVTDFFPWNHKLPTEQK